MNLDPHIDSTAKLIQDYPQAEPVIQSIYDDYKRSTSMFIHELRNPLSLLRGTLQYIETKHPEVKEYKYWDQLDDLMKDMETMMANASQLNFTLNKEPNDMIAFIESLINQYMPKAIDKNIDLALSLESGCESHFRSYLFDESRLKQALSNLIKNAFEATNPGGYIHIHLSYIPADNESMPKLSIEVSNNGDYIPEDTIETIFTPFITYKEGGSGIGLAVVKKIIEMHFGSISVVSNPEVTKFTILLPSSQQ